MTAAESACKKSISLEPDCNNLLNLADIYLKTGRLKEARETTLRAKGLPEAKQLKFKQPIEANLDWLNRQHSKKTAGE